MEEIKVGEYGRTDLGNILKFDWLENSNGVRDENYIVRFIKGGPVKYYLHNEKIIKHSKNIIDLIEIRRFYK